MKLHYLPNIGLRAALQARYTGQYPRTVDEIVDIDEDLQDDAAMWNQLIDFILKGSQLITPPKP